MTATQQPQQAAASGASTRAVDLISRHEHALSPKGQFNRLRVLYHDGMAGSLIDHVPLTLPDLAPGLGGLRIAQISDLHVGRPRRRHERIIALVGELDVDFVFLTGDYMNVPGDEANAMAMLERLVPRLKPRLGVLGVFGNHDSWEIRRLCKDLPMRWLADECVAFADGAIHVIGFESHHHRHLDALAMLADMDRQGLTTAAQTRRGEEAPGPLRLVLSHYPMYLPTVADLGADVMFSGHTHGGQLRLPGHKALMNSSDLPLRLSSGILRHRRTLCAVSRGLGESWVPLRFFCRPHLPIYTLHRGPLPGSHTDHIENVNPW